MHGVCWSFEEKVEIYRFRNYVYDEVYVVGEDWI